MNNYSYETSLPPYLENITTNKKTQCNEVLGFIALVASKLNRNFIGIELNPEYVKLSQKRLQNQLGMFNTLTL